jgi:hypothetical protein
MVSATGQCLKSSYKGIFGLLTKPVICALRWLPPPRLNAAIPTPDTGSGGGHAIDSMFNVSNLALK